MDAITDRPFEKIDLRLVELIYRQDPGWFTCTLNGVLYCLTRARSRETTERMLSSLAFRIDCPAEKQQATYAQVYDRWASTTEEGKSTVKEAMRPGPDGLEPTTQVKRAVFEVRRLLAEGHAVDMVKRAAQHVLCLPTDNLKPEFLNTLDLAWSDATPAINDVWPAAISQPQPRRKEDTTTTERSSAHDTPTTTHCRPSATSTPVSPATQIIQREVLQRQAEAHRIRSSNKRKYEQYAAFYRRVQTYGINPKVIEPRQPLPNSCEVSPTDDDNHYNEDQINEAGVVKELRHVEDAVVGVVRTSAVGKRKRPQAEDEGVAFVSMEKSPDTTSTKTIARGSNAESGAGRTDSGPTSNPTDLTHDPTSSTEDDLYTSLSQTHQAMCALSNYEAATRVVDERVHLMHELLRSRIMVAKYHTRDKAAFDALVDVYHGSGRFAEVAALRLGWWAWD